MKEYKNTRYTKARQRIVNITHNKNITDFEIIENMEDEIDYYRNKIKLLEKVKEEQKEYINNNLNIKAMIEDMIEVQSRIEFEGIEGIIQNIKDYKSSTLYADNRPYCRLVYYEIEVLTDNMYTITIKPIGEETIKDIYYEMKNDKKYIIK